MRVNPSDFYFQNIDKINQENLINENKETISKHGPKKINLNEKQAQEVAKEFETMFVDMMLKSMRETARPTDESNAQNIYSTMLDGEYSKVMTEGTNFGIRDMILGWVKQNS